MPATLTTFSERRLEKDEKLVLIVDIESTGYGFNINPLLAIGWVVASLEKDEIFEKGRVSLKPCECCKTIKKSNKCLVRDDWVFDKRCYDGFWSKNLHVLNTLFDESESPRDAIDSFLDVEYRYPIGYVMSDNPAYDLTRIDSVIHKHSTRQYGMHYDRKGNYRSVIDPSAAFDYLPKDVKDMVEWKSNTHFPDDDALCIYKAHLSLKKVCESLVSKSN